MLKQAVIDNWHKVTEPLEGRVPHMYADIKGLITVGVGNLIDPKRAALALPWKTQTGAPASPAQVDHEWENIKAHALELAHRSLAVQATYTSVRLLDADIDALVLSKLKSNAAHVETKHFPDFGTFPADAQLAIMSIAWAVGPDFPLKFPKFSAAVREGDWAAAADVCDIRVGKKGQPDYNPGVIPRNKMNRLCLANAFGVVYAGLDREPLHYPNDAGDTAPLFK